MEDLLVTLRTRMSELVTAGDDKERRSAADALGQAATAFAQASHGRIEADLRPALERDATALAATGLRLAAIGDRDLLTFNQLLPWAAMTVDPKGRPVGQPFSATKRAKGNALIDPRILAFDQAFPLAGKHVLELGCFEGIHTIGCLLKGATVTGVDGRVENILKTMARLWAYRQQADLVLWNVEQEPPADLPQRWDVLHHVGVLYHLTNPVDHLRLLLPRTAQAVILDTHVATDPEQATEAYEADGRSWRYWHYREKQVATNPFAGMLDHAKWLLPEDLMGLLREGGFTDVRLVEDRPERNGRRVLIWAFR